MLDIGFGEKSVVERHVRRIRMRRISKRGAKRDLRSSVGAALMEVRRYLAKIYPACVRSRHTCVKLRQTENLSNQFHAKIFDRDSPLTQSICFLWQESTNWKWEIRILVAVICKHFRAAKIDQIVSK